MASAAEHRRKGIASHPFLLAAGLGLFWFAETPQGGLPIDAPALGFMLIPMSRLLLDLVGGWVVVSGVRILLALGRLGLIRWHLPGAGEIR